MFNHFYKLRFNLLFSWAALLLGQMVLQILKGVKLELKKKIINKNSTNFQLHVNSRQLYWTRFISQITKKKLRPFQHYSNRQQLKTDLILSDFKLPGIVRFAACFLWISHNCRTFKMSCYRLKSVGRAIS